jgi:hypothetical protein
MNGEETALASGYQLSAKANATANAHTDEPDLTDRTESSEAD